MMGEELLIIPGIFNILIGFGWWYERERLPKLDLRPGKEYSAPDRGVLLPPTPDQPARPLPV